MSTINYLDTLDDWEEIERRSQNQLTKNDGYVPWGTNVVEGAKDLAGRAVGQLQEWAKEDPDTWTDDVLRLMGGGVKNTGAFMEDLERRSEEGEVGIRSAAGTALRFMNWSSEKGADIGGAVVGALGGNEDIGRFLGSFLPEAIGAKGLSKAAQIGKTTKQLRKLRKLGYGLEVDDITKGRHAFAYADEVLPDPSVWDDLGTAATANKTARRRLGKIHEQAERIDQRSLTISDKYRAIPKTTNITNEMLDEQLLIRNQAEKLLAEAGPNPSKGQLDKINSMKSTTIEILPDDPAFYSNQSKALKLKHTQYEDKLNKLGTLQWHHQTMKAVSAPFLDRAWDIVRANGGTQADILNLHHIALNHGVGMGDRLSALLPMGRVPHTKLHTWARKAGIQPTSAQIKEITEQLKGATSMEELTKLFRDELKRIAEPITREAKIMKNVWEDLSPVKRSQLASLRKQRDEVTRAITKAKKNKKSTRTLEKQLENINNQYDPLKKDLVEEFFENRPSYGDYTDEYGKLYQESTWYQPEGQYGKAEQARERAVESLHDLVKDY